MMFDIFGGFCDLQGVGSTVVGSVAACQHIQKSRHCIALSSSALQGSCLGEYLILRSVASKLEIFFSPEPRHFIAFKPFILLKDYPTVCLRLMYL